MLIATLYENTVQARFTGHVGQWSASKVPEIELMPKLEVFYLLVMPGFVSKLTYELDLSHKSRLEYITDS